MLGSIGVIVGALVIRFTGWTIADPITCSINRALGVTPHLDTAAASGPRPDDGAMPDGSTSARSAEHTPGHEGVKDASPSTSGHWRPRGGAHQRMSVAGDGTAANGDALRAGSLRCWTNASGSSTQRSGEAEACHDREHG